MNDLTATSPRPDAAMHFGKLSLLEKLGFGAGDLASNLLFQTFNMFLLFFYTDVVGLSAGAIFWIFLVAKLWDMINDPMMGAIADRTHTRWGRYRPYIFALAIPYGVSVYMLFMVPDMSDLAKVFYCGATYIFATMMYTGVNIPYCALMGVITPDVQERTSVSQYRFFMAFVGGWMINTFTLPLVRLLGNDTSSDTYNATVGYDPVAGYPATMMIFGILSALLFFMTFFMTKERVVPVARENSPFKDDMKDLMRNYPWIILFISAVLYLAHHAIRNGAMLYYLNYYVADSGRVLFTLNFGFFELEATRVVLFMSAGSLCAIFGVLPVQYLVRRIDKRTLYVFVLMIQGLAEGLIYFAPKESYNLIFALHLLSNLVGGAGPVIVFAMYADVADYSEWKTSRRATGLIIATILFAFKGGLWVGAQILTGVLASIGYTKATATEPHIQQWIVLLFTWIPAAMTIAAGLLLLRYTITDKLMMQIEVELEERKLARA